VRVLLAGATGAIGRRLVPALLAGGHEVIGMVRSEDGARAVEAMGARCVETPGARSVLADALDADATMRAVAEASPQVLIHQLTSLPQRINPRTIERDFELNDRLRDEGTRNLVDAAQAAGVERVIAQSIAFAYAPGPPGTVHSEADPLFSDAQAPKSFRRSAAALRSLESSVLGAGGLVMRYGFFYGPGTAFARDGSTAQDVSKRRFPIVGKGGGVWSFIHIDDAAAATIAALERGSSGPYNIVDDDPAPVREWLPAFAEALGAPAPMRVPKLIARLAAGSYGVLTLTRSQGASNALAKEELGWGPVYSSWREGFRTALD